MNLIKKIKLRISIQKHRDSETNQILQILRKEGKIDFLHYNDPAKIFENLKDGDVIYKPDLTLDRLKSFTDLESVFHARRFSIFKRDPDGTRPIWGHVGAVFYRIYDSSSDTSGSPNLYRVRAGSTFRYEGNDLLPENTLDYSSITRFKIKYAVYDDLAHIGLDKRTRKFREEIVLSHDALAIEKYQQIMVEIGGRK